MFEDNVSKKDDKLYEIFLDFRRTDFNQFRMRCNLFLAFAVYFEVEAKSLIKEVNDFLQNVETHRKLLFREAWGSDAAHLIEYVDEKDSPSFDPKFEKQLLQIDKKIKDFIFNKSKDLYPQNSIDVSRVQFK